MNKFKFPFSFFIFCFCIIAVAAQGQVTYFMKNNGQRLNKREGSDFIRLVYNPETSRGPYKVMDYYLNGNQKAVGYSQKADPVVYEGPMVSFYENGNKKLVGIYEKGKLRDTAHTFFPNGKLYTTMVYVNAADPKENKKYVVAVNDSLGKAMVVNGSGTCSFYTSDFKSIAESGKIENGLYEGEWNGFDKPRKLNFTETYAGGKFVSGKSVDANGQQTTYTVQHKQPDFKNGIKEFYRYLSKNMKYPESCRNSRIQGTVRLKFTVLKNGNVDRIEVVSSPHTDLATEAVRVLSESPKWEPGIYKGRLTDMLMNVPITFSLGGYTTTTRSTSRF